MHFQPSATAARWNLSRWLLIVLVLAGLGIWQGAHCADDMVGHAGDADIAGVHVHGSAEHVAVSATAHRQGDLAVSANPDVPGSAGQCHPLVSTFTGYTAASMNTAQQPCVHIRVASQERPRPVQPVPSGITLIALGISRI